MWGKTPCFWDFTLTVENDTNSFLHKSDTFRNAKIISWRGLAVLSKWNTTAGIDSLNKSFNWHWSSWNRRHQRWSILQYDDQYCNTNYAILLWIFTSQTTKGWVLEISYKYMSLYGLRQLMFQLALIFTSKHLVLLLSLKPLHCIFTDEKGGWFLLFWTKF